MTQQNDNGQNPSMFNPNDHLIQLRSKEGAKDYLPVAWRMVWFREHFPHGTIDTELLQFDPDRDVEEESFVWNSEKRRSEKVMKHAKGFAMFRAVVTDGEGGRATGTKCENAASFPDYVEKSETGSIGRALAALGYGTQFTGQEFDESHRIVDSPVERQVAPAGNQSNGQQAITPRPQNAGSTPQTQQNADPADITEQQLASIRKLCEHLRKAVPADVATLSFVGAKRLIQQLTAEYRESRPNNRAS